MSKDVVATSENIQSIIKMLDVLQRVKDDSSKLREISLDNTGWEGMDASSFNTALNSFTQKLDKTSTDIEEALKAYKSKQEEQLENTSKAESVAKYLDQGGLAEYNKNPKGPWSNELIRQANERNSKEAVDEILNRKIWSGLPSKATSSKATPSNATPSNATPSDKVPSNDSKSNIITKEDIRNLNLSEKDIQSATRTYAPYYTLPSSSSN